MTNITGTEPRHWHDGGKHRMPDLRKISYPEKFWDSDERAYIAHLREHETNAKFPKPTPEDSETVKNLFKMIALSERTAHNAREMIIALRRAGKGTVDQVKENDHAGHIPDA
jgi:hypothetical protein